MSDAISIAADSEPDLWELYTEVVGDYAGEHYFFLSCVGFLFILLLY